MSQEMHKDEALFRELEQKKKRRRRRIMVTVVSILVVVAVVLVVAVSYLRTHVRERYGTSGIDVRSAQVIAGTLRMDITGKGVLADEGLERITVPEGVTLTEVLVEAGDTVNEGQALASVDMSSVLTAMAALQTSLEDLDDQIADAADDKASTSVTTAVAGRVKQIWAETGMAVTDCMVSHGALAVLSLDGYMAIDIPGEGLAAGDAVTVIREDGRELAGSVDTVILGTATVLVTDNGPRNGETVTVTREGVTLGEGQLYIHEPLAVTGYAGTIQSVSVTENRQVYKNSTLFRLTDTATSHVYDALLRTRSQQEETLLELLTLQRTGAVLAPFGGSVFSLDHEQILAPTAVVTLSPDQKMTVTVTVAEADILALSEGLEAEITVSSVADEPFPGTVTEIDRTAATGSYTATVTLHKAEGMLPGMTASVSIRTDGVENALLIPAEALYQTRNRAYVYTSYDPETEVFGGEVDVTVGIMGSDEVEILSGLTEGDTVWYRKELDIFDFFAGMSGGSMPGGSTPGSGRPSGSGGSRPSGMPSGGWG